VYGNAVLVVIILGFHYCLVYLILNLVDNFVINAIVLEQMSIQQCLL